MPVESDIPRATAEAPCCPCLMTSVASARADLVVVVVFRERQWLLALEGREGARWAILVAIEWIGNTVLIRGRLGT